MVEGTYEADEVDVSDTIKQYKMGSSIFPLDEEVSDCDKIIHLESDFVFEQTTESDEWNINHGLDMFGVVVDVYDENNDKLQYDKIKVVDSNNVTITFSSAVKGKAFIKKMFSRELNLEDISYLEKTQGTEHNIQHDLNTDALIVHIYDNELNKIIPKSIEIINNNEIKVNTKDNIIINTIIKGLEKDSLDYFKSKSWVIYSSSNVQNMILGTYSGNEPITPDYLRKYDNNYIILDNDKVDKVVYVYGDNTSTRSEATSADEVEHDYPGVGLFHDSYDEDGYRLYPSSAKLEEDKVSLEFDEPVKGYSLSLFGADFTLSETVSKIKNSKLWISDEKGLIESGDYKISVDLDRFRETDDKFLLEYSIDKGLNINIKEMAIMSESDEIVYYSDCSDLYKHKDFLMNIFYKINKVFKQGEN